MNKELLTKMIDDSIAFLKKGWCKGAFAKDKSGRVTFLDDPESCCWCLLGALSAAKNKNNVSLSEWDLMIGYLHTKMPDFQGHRIGFTTFNDSQESVEPILKWLERVKQTTI